jgi:hypothetical protein
MAVGSTRVSRVQFGVPPNCVGARAIYVTRTINDKPCLQKVSGVTPETTRETRVLPINLAPRASHLAFC